MGNKILAEWWKGHQYIELNSKIFGWKSLSMSSPIQVIILAFASLYFDDDAFSKPQLNPIILTWSHSWFLINYLNQNILTKQRQKRSDLQIITTSKSQNRFAEILFELTQVH